MPWPRCAYISTASMVSGSRFHFHHRPLRPAGQVRAVAPLQHQPLDGGGARAFPDRRTAPPDRQTRTSGDKSMQLRPRRAPRTTPPAAGAARSNGQRPHVLRRRRTGCRTAEHATGKSRIIRARRPCGSAAAADSANGATVAVADHQQLAVQHALRSPSPRRFPGTRPEMSSAPREYSRSPAGVATSCTRMPSHFHSARKARGVERGEIRRLQRVRQHRRPEHRRVSRIGARPPPSSQANSPS